MFKILLLLQLVCLKAVAMESRGVTELQLALQRIEQLERIQGQGNYREYRHHHWELDLAERRVVAPVRVPLLGSEYPTRACSMVNPDVPGVRNVPEFVVRVPPPVPVAVRDEDLGCCGVIKRWWSGRGLTQQEKHLLDAPPPFPPGFS